MGTNADVPTLVRAALQGGGPRDAEPDRSDSAALARQALVQLGFSSAVAEKAVAAARAHVGTPTDLAAMIKEALRHCWYQRDDGRNVIEEGAGGCVYL